MDPFFLVDSDTYASTDWQASPVWSVGPVPITAGEHDGKYAVNTDIFACSDIFEKYRTLLESMPTAECSNLNDWFPTPLS